MGKGTVVSPGDGITAAKMNLKTEAFMAHINLLPEGTQAGLAADTIGVKYAGKSLICPYSQMLGRDDKVYIEASLVGSAAGIEVTVEIYDVTAAAVAASYVWTGLPTAAPTRAISGNIAANLTAGNEVQVRFNVTTAVAAATFDANAARLVVVGG